MPLYGRAHELDAVRSVAGGARNGRGSSLLVEGAPGVGKTAILHVSASQVGSATRAMGISGFDVESALPYAALQRLVDPLLTYVGDLPDVQQAALRVAVGLGPGEPPQRALVGLSTLSLLARAGDDVPTVCFVDDAHHLDVESMEVLGFVARRLSAERVAVVLAAREDESTARAFAGVARLPVSGLDREAAAAVLRHAAGGHLDPTVVAELVRYTGGNPLALEELGSQWSTDALTDAAIAHEPVPVGRRLEEHYGARVDGLGAGARLWLLVAAAESTGNVWAVREAAAAVGLADGASSDAEASGLVEVRDQVRFRHPLVRSAVYGGARDADRRRVHSALHQVATSRGWREVAAWHGAAASGGTDDVVAAELVAVADLAAARGGLVSRAQLLARAADLSTSPAARGELLVAAAESAISAGAARLAGQLADRVAPEHLGAVARGRRLLVRAMCGLFLSDAAELRSSVVTLLTAADAFHGVAPALEQRALLMAVTFTLTTEDSSVGWALEDLGERLRVGAGSADGHYAAALRAAASFILDDYETAVPLLRAAVRVIDGLDDEELLEFSFYCVSPTVGLWDAERAAAVLRRTVRVGRERGALREVDSALWVLSAVELARMNPRAAGEYLAQAEELRRALGYRDEQATNVAYLAWRGMPRGTVEQVARAMLESGFGGVARMALGAVASNEIADGEYQAAFTRLQEMVSHPHLQARFPYLAELAEAAARSGNRRAAQDAAERLARYAAATGSAWASGLAERAAGLLADDGSAETHFLASVAHLDGAGHRGDRGRSRLAYGEWLRRAGRRTEARGQLQSAWEDFEAVGAEAFSRRARRELKATGGHPAAVISLDLTDLTDLTLVGHSTGGGEVARYMGRHGSGRVAKVVLVSAVTPFLLRTDDNPGGAPVETFDAIRAGEAHHRSQLYRDLADGPFFGHNRTGDVPRGIRDAFWLQSLASGTRNAYECIAAFSATDFRPDLEKLDVPTLVIHGDDDQIVPFEISGRLSAQLVPGAQLIVYEGGAHGLPDTERDRLHADLLAFVES